MTYKLVVIINSLKVPKIEKILLYEMKFIVPNYSCLQNPWLGGYRPQIPVLSVLNWICWTPPPKKIRGYATGAYHPLPSSNDVMYGYVRYLYLTSVLSWPVIGWSLPFSMPHDGMAVAFVGWRFRSSGLLSLRSQYTWVLATQGWRGQGLSAASRSRRSCLHENIAIRWGKFQSKHNYKYG